MKKLLLGIVIILIIVLLGVAIAKGISIGKLKILGINDIKNKNDELDEKIKEATKIASTDYQKKIDDLDENVKKLEKEKKTYDDMVSVSTDSEVQASNQTYENTIEFLLVRIDNHAKNEGVEMRMDVTRSTSGATDVYNLNFTVTGGYAQIEEFITDIEDDSKLGYKIEDFKMTSASGNGDTVQATFVCRDIKIKGISGNTTSSKNTTINTTENKTENTTENTTKE